MSTPKDVQKTILIILDGWGIANDALRSAIDRAGTPVMDRLMDEYPSSMLRTSGEDVGLPEGQMGNSEVGHLNLGAGRIVWQELANINKSIRERTIDNNPALAAAFNYALQSGCKVHFIGLVSDGGVHSHIHHLKHLTAMAAEAGLKRVYIHAFTDGRDTDPKGGIDYLSELDAHLAKTTGTIASVTGRYYAMDRDQRWERVKIAYDALVDGKGERMPDWKKGMMASYASGVTDEFIKPLIITGSDGEPDGCIEEGDVVICFNFRTDRCREITMALTQRDFPEHAMKSKTLHFVTMTRYDESFKDISVIFEKDNLAGTLGEVLELYGKHQLRIAETEKYPHVTYFFSGGREQPFKGETRIMIPSPKVATYDLQPEMSAREVSAAVCDEIAKGEHDFICLNYANADMVGHTGVFEAAVRAVETVDNCLGKVVEAGLTNGYELLIIADHGNADMMINEDGSPNTAHTTNPVPCLLVSRNKEFALANGRLADVAPTLLTLMGIPLPNEMSGKSLLRPKS